MITFQDIIDLAEEGNTDAMVAAIQKFVWESDNEDNPVVKEKVREYLTKAIFSGNVEAMNQLGAMFAEGRMVEADPEEAFKCYKMASEHGDALASSNLGFCYMYGNGTEKNLEEAFKAFSKAALLGIGDAIIRVGDMYMFGNYVSKDPKTAYVMYSKAYKMASQDLNDWGNQQIFSDVTRRLGDCYYYGNAVERNLAKAISFYSTALEYYEIRARKKDSYYHSGMKKTKEMLQKAFSDLSVE